MRFARTPALRSTPSNLSVLDLAPRASSLLAEVLAGLGEPRKRLPPKLFYDARGAELFNRICGTQAYYPTRTERAILTRHAEDIAHHLGPGRVVVEPGAGDMHKVRILLPALQPRAYVPIDIWPDQLLEEAESLAREHRWLQVVAVSADFHARELNGRLTLPSGRRVVFFPGSTIGNFEPGEALDFLRRARELVAEAGAALIGVDLDKPKPILDRAYNDPEGYTAQFNLNVLARINREMGADFDLGAFSHRAFYNDAHGRIEMHLVCTRRCTVSVADRRFEFGAGETIHTENSYKYAPEIFARMARVAGFSTARRWSDAGGWFGVFLFT